MDQAQKFSQLNAILNEVQDLKSAQSVLVWDQSTYMPQQGAAMRGRQMATLGKLAHEKFTQKEVGVLLAELEGYEQKFSHSSYEFCFLRHVRKEYEKAIKLNSDFVAQTLEHQSTCYNVWAQARAENNFSIVVPYLQKTLEYSLRYAEHFKFDHIADPLIAESDEGFTTAYVQDVFGKLRQELVPLVKKVVAQGEKSEACLQQNFSVPQQEKFNHELAQLLGYDFTRGRLDKTHHPFMITFAHGDVRITTRYKENHLSEGLFSTIHEAGHAFYEMGVDPSLDGTLLYGGASSGVHESQSRLWENLVGRGLNFWEYMYPKLQNAFPTQLKNVDLHTFYQAINCVRPSLIRTDADELTYNLHVMIRFDLELALLDGELTIQQLPEAWNARYASDLGVRVPSDAQGCLQDVHWFSSFIGGQFQGYTLGNLMSAQFYQAASQALPTLESDLKKGTFSGLRGWLGENLHVHGKKYLGLEVLKMATGSDLVIDPYVAYLEKKFL